MTALHLTHRDLTHLDAAQRALLAPLAAESAEAWQLRANRAVRRFLGADHSAFSLPGARAPELVSDDTDPELPARLHGYVLGVAAGEYRFRDPFMQRAVSFRRRGGTGAYHQRMFCAPEEAARSPAYQELFRPAGMAHMIGLSTPQPVGEATQFFGFAGGGGAAASEAAFARLRLLVPAFAAGVRVHDELGGRRAAVARLVDELDAALAVYSSAGRPLHRSRALQELLAFEPDGRTLRRALDRFGRALARRWGGRPGGGAAEPAEVTRRVATSAAEYRLAASTVSPELFGEDGVLVLVRRVRTVLPMETELRSRFGLTRREAEITLLLAEGLSDGAVAGRLSISRHTARRHSERVLKKLGVGSRAAIALTLLRERRE